MSRGVYALHSKSLSFFVTRSLLLLVVAAAASAPLQPVFAQNRVFSSGKLPSASIELKPTEPAVTQTPWRLPKPGDSLYDAGKEAEINNNKDVVRVFERGVFKGYITHKTTPPPRDLLTIREIRLAQVAANDNFTLTISIWTRPRVQIDRNKVTVRVLFYDTIDPNMVVLTDSDSTHKWLTKSEHWMKENPQVLTVHHSRPKRRVDNFGPRRHLGYIIRLFYEGRLQDVVSKPEKLLPLFTQPNPASPPQRSPR